MEQGIVAKLSALRAQPKGSRGVVMASALAALVGFMAAFHWHGNPVRGYLDTSSIFVWWVSQWFIDGAEAEHGPFLLAVAGWVFLNEVRASAQGATRYRPGLATLLLVTGFALHAVGYLVLQTRISIMGFLIAAIGACWAFGGDRYGRACSTAAAFLVLSLPLQALNQELGHPMRLAITHICSMLGDATGIEVARQGTHLISPAGQFALDVAPACAGIRSLSALAALGLLAGYLLISRWWAMAFLAGLSLPLAFMGNVLRIYGTMVAGALAGPQASAWAHDVLGIAIFGLVFGASLVAAWLLRKAAFRDGETKPAPAPVDPRPSTAPHLRAIWLAGLILGLTSVHLGMARAVDGMRPAPSTGVFLATDGRNPAPLPLEIGGRWEGQPMPMDRAEAAILPSDTGLARAGYRDRLQREPAVLASIVLSGSDRSSIHRPELCLTGAGWTLSERRRAVWEVQGRVIPVTLLRLEREMGIEGESTRIEAWYAYWFVGGKRMVRSHLERMAWTAWERLFRLRTQRWAYITLLTPSEGEVAALLRLEAMAAALVPSILRDNARDASLPIAP